MKDSISADSSIAINGRVGARGVANDNLGAGYVGTQLLVEQAMRSSLKGFLVCSLQLPKGHNQISQFFVFGKEIRRRHPKDLCQILCGQEVRRMLAALLLIDPGRGVVLVDARSNACTTRFRVNDSTHRGITALSPSTDSRVWDLTG